MEQKNKPASGRNNVSLTSESFHHNQCPFLGAARDPDTVLAYSSTANRCYAFQDSDHVDREKQRVHCLSSSFAECERFQQGIKLPSETRYGSRSMGPFSQILQVRTLAVGIMLVLILLAALIWWPAPGLSRQERTVFSAPFNQESQAAQIEGEETVVQNEASQTSSANQKTEPAAIAAEADSEKLEIAAPAAGSERPATESSAKKSEPESEVLLQIPISNLPDLYEVFQVQPEDGEQEVKPVSSFSPITYSNQGVAIPWFQDGTETGGTLLVYRGPDVIRGQPLRLSRFEPVSILGRDRSSSWLKMRTESGIEGWIRIADTKLGDWVYTQPEIENVGGATEVESITTSLPVVSEAQARRDNIVVRSAPGPNFKRITYLNEGDAINLLGRWKEGPWVRIRLDDDTEGWVKSTTLDPPE